MEGFFFNFTLLKLETHAIFNLIKETMSNPRANPLSYQIIIKKAHKKLLRHCYNHMENKLPFA